ncbi:anhydro-N-acetylmuramic acid kinase [Plebeiibacterium marinum]|uniref:Anhydro-N-acetylmuramic acid kinase n=1 Tax=Plebeiibacterium marinum TaxID=2992111 RepID=A0AAE3SMH7_9BACT|nr:anhydro-N-acetylmuramic acid kinase [Plebeiobacterium marinum]MCW3807565.1 anhydro-N-acetylmuramic acid kinase [Plebeiobacterium marinum]
MADTEYRVVGIMSGTSLDGLDMALCNFKWENGTWSFKIVKAETKEYPKIWKEKLEHAQENNALAFVELHRMYGRYMGQCVKSFMEGMGDVDFVASHGHTVFHKPELDTTFQIGCGAYLAAASGYDTVSDFRTLDIAFGGQGAPLVPIGDKMLFPGYDACVNLGGFANISFEKKGELLAYDICPVNFVLNKMMWDNYKLPYDFGGEKGRSGNVDYDVLKRMDALPYYCQDGPKSLAREWVENEFLLLLEDGGSSVEDMMATCYHHFANQIAQVLDKNKLKRVLFTGGGAYNDYLIELVKEKSETDICIPSKEVVDYKEALIFAFLGVLRYEHKNNCLKSVTGSIKDNIGGCIYLA